MSAVSKDGPLAHEYVAHPSRRTFGPPQDEVGKVEREQKNGGLLSRRFKFWMVRVVTGLL